MRLPPRSARRRRRSLGACNRCEGAPPTRARRTARRARRRPPSPRRCRPTRSRYPRSVAEIDGWLKEAKEHAANAAAEGDVDTHVKYVRLAATLIEARRKAAPVPKPDPNDSPDMVAAAKAARKRWHVLLDALHREASK